MDLVELIDTLDGLILDVRSHVPNGRQKSIALTDLETARWRLSQVICTEEA